MKAIMQFAAALLCATAAVTHCAAAPNDNSSARPAATWVAEASELHRFEKSIQPAPSSNRDAPARETAHHHDAEHDDDSGIMQGLTDWIGELAAQGGRASLQSIDPASDVPLHRGIGNPLIPFVRYDFDYQRISGDISAHVNRFETGYGPVALFVERSVFDERLPPTTLEIDRLMLLYRMSDGEAEVDFGVGQSSVTGAWRTDGAIMSLRARFKFDENFSMELLPAWGNGMDSYEAALQWGRQFGSIKAGYRMLRSSGPSLNGPFAGVALYF